MPLIKNDRLVKDVWVSVDDDREPPLAQGIIVSLERWQAERETLAGLDTPLGVRLRSDQPPSLIAEDLEHFALVALEFPAFKDGRAFSYARLLRERHGFRGELRAVGEVLRDQSAFMKRCGFDAFEVARESDVEAWRGASAEISVHYQPSTDRRAWATLQRHGPGVFAQPESEPDTAHRAA